MQKRHDNYYALDICAHAQGVTQNVASQGPPKAGGLRTRLRSVDVRRLKWGSNLFISILDPRLSFKVADFPPRRSGCIGLTCQVSLVSLEEGNI